MFDLLARSRTALAGALTIAAATAGIAVAATSPGSDGDRVSLGAQHSARAAALPDVDQQLPASARGLESERAVAGVVPSVVAPSGARAALGEGKPAPASVPAINVETASAFEPEPGTEPDPAPVAEPPLEAPAPPPVDPTPPAEPVPAPEVPAPEPEPEAPAPEPEPEVPAPEPEPEPPAPEPEPEPEVPPGPSKPVPPEPPAKSQPALTIGIDGGYAGWSAQEVAARTQLGAAVTRHEWHPEQSVQSEEEQVLAAATEMDTRIDALLGGNELGDADHYRDWVVAFVRHYGPGGTFWSEHPQLDARRFAIDTIELGNEPYFGTMSAVEYADTVRPTLERIQQLDLPVTVILPSWVYGEETDWVDTLYQRIPDLNSMFDGFAYHPYWYGHDPAQHGAAGPFDRITTLRERMDTLGAGEKSIFLTEYGESTAACGSECVSEQVQAEHLQAMIDAVSSRKEWKIEQLTIYQLMDRGTGSPAREEQFGLIREDGTPKPAYAVVRAAMAKYRG
jgi:hypothetical protein